MRSATERSGPVHIRRALAAAAALVVGAALAACNSTTSTTLPPAIVQAQEPDTLSGPTGAALDTGITVRVLDDTFRPVPNSVVTFTVSPASGATLNPTTAATNDSGFARTKVTLGTTAGADTVTATDATAGVPPATFYLFVNGLQAQRVAADVNRQSAAVRTEALARH